MKKNKNHERTSRGVGLGYSLITDQEADRSTLTHTLSAGLGLIIRRTVVIMKCFDG